jgi:Methyltransferase domain
MKRLPGRIVERELLDELPPSDPRALRSRRDLRLLNFGMRHPPTMAAALLKNLRDTTEGTPHKGTRPAIVTPRIVELGAGDGHFLLAVAQRLRSKWPAGEATLVDRLDSFEPKIGERFKRLGWRVRTEKKTAMEWLQQSPPGTADAIICNLFLHQFQASELTEMLQLAARSTGLLVALEPSRSWMSRACGGLLWAIGCGQVTRHDAAISIRAGFDKRELSELWPDKQNWSLTERPAGLFSHLFIARRAST